jgi:hypothetical protein
MASISFLVSDFLQAVSLRRMREQLGITGFVAGFAFVFIVVNLLDVSNPDD